MDRVDIRVEAGVSTLADVQTAIDEILADLRAGGDLAEDARAQGLELPEDLTITAEEPAGLEPVTAIIVAFAGAAGKEFAKRAWNDLILPEIRRRRGADAVGPSRED
jgi:hypothetical protein